MKNNSLPEVRVLHLSTHDEECGIGKYQESFLHYMAKYPGVHNEFYPPSLNHLKKLTGEELAEELNTFENTLKNFDILHIQHEFGLFSGLGEGLSQFVNIAKKLHKKVIITIHTAPGLILKNNTLERLSPRGVVGYVKRGIINKKIIATKLLPFRKADKVITLNSFTTQQLIELIGVSKNSIIQSQIPIEGLTKEPKNSILRKKMGLKKSDILLCTHGFITPYKGVFEAIKALTLLPDKYKLAILGGTNPDSGDPRVYDEVCEQIEESNLKNRVYISGYIQNDETLEELLRGCDIALYPYDLEYYRLASSAAITKAIMNKLPVIAYPTQSFQEINKFSAHAIVLTKGDDHHELAREIQKLDINRQIKNSESYAEANSFDIAAQELIGLYKNLMSSSQD